MMAFPIVVGLSSSIIFVVLLLKLVQRNRMLQGESADVLSESSQNTWSEEWFEEFSSFRYLPMRRLLSPEEEEYWASSAPDTNCDRAQFRAERRHLFRQYLQLIGSDFERLSQGVRLSAIHAAEDRTADISRLLQLEWSLRKLLWQAELRLTFHWLGLQPVDATALINALQGFEFSLREIRIGATA